VPGDVNLDNVVDVQDTDVLIEHMGRSGDRSDGEFTFDGIVDLKDFYVAQPFFGFGAGWALQIWQLDIVVGVGSDQSFEYGQRRTQSYMPANPNGSGHRGDVRDPTRDESNTTDFCGELQRRERSKS
jgi:hypothetical protein